MAFKFYAVKGKTDKAFSKGNYQILEEIEIDKELFKAIKEYKKNG